MKRILSLLKRAASCTSGTAALEGIIVIPVAISLMAGGIEFGRVFTNYTLADRAIRSAARYLARVPSSAVCGWGLTNAKKLAVFGTITPSNSDQPLVTGWAVGDVTLNSPDCVGGALDVIDLRSNVSYSGQMLSAIGLSNALTFTVQHQERYIGE